MGSTGQVHVVEYGQRGSDVQFASLIRHLNLGNSSTVFLELVQQPAEMRRAVHERALIVGGQAIEDGVHCLELIAGRVGGEDIVVHGAFVGRSSGGCWFPSPNSCASAARPRAIRLFTVPTGMPSVSAISA